MKKNNKPELPGLRQRAEERLKLRTDIASNVSTAAETLKLIHEFEVHQIELEIQNQELTLAKEQALIDREKYIELYDLAPTGYFTLSRDGEIIQLNITGAKMLGKARSQLKNRLFHLFVSDNSKPFFLLFLEKVFDRHEKEICELTLPTNDDIPMYVYITGIVSGNGRNCLITAIDITERKLLESSVVEKMILQCETEKAGKIGGWSFNVKTLIQNWTIETFNILEIDTMKGTPQVPEGIEFIDESFRQTAEIAIKRAIEFGEPFEQEWKVTTAKGNKRWVNVVGKTKIVKGKTVGLFGSFQDITERKLAEKQIERLNRVYTVLSSINKTIIRVREKQLLFEEACRLAIENGGFKMAWIGMVNSTTNKIEVVASSGKTGEYLNNINIDLNNETRSSGPVGLAIKSGKYNFSNNIQIDDNMVPWRKNARKYGFQSVITLPIIVFGKTIGAYSMYSGEIDFFNEDEIILLEEMALDISYAIEFIESEKERKQAEESLLASEMKYHNIFNNVQDVFYQTDLAGTVLEVSPSIRIFSGFNRDEIIGKPVASLYYDPNDRINILYLLKEKGELRDYELRLKNKAGEIKYTSNNAKLVFDSEGKPDHIDGAVRDITERKLMQEKLKQSEERFQLAMKASKDGLFDWNLETNEIYYAPGWKRIIGYEDHELPNDISVWEQTTDPLDVKKSWELHLKLITKQIDRFVLEFKMKHKDGHWVDILSQANAIFNNDGKAIRIVGTHTDISERKKAEEALRESNRILVESQAVANIGAYVTELTATEFETNAWKATPEIYKIFGIDETYPHTRAGWTGLVHPDSREELLAYHYQVVAERKRFDHEYKIIRINDGEERWVHGTGELEYDNQQNPIQMLGTIQDITERKQNETELIEKEVQFRNLSNAGLALIWTSGTDKLCNYFNEKWLTFTGRKLEQEMGNGWAEGVHPDDFDRCVETYFTAFDKREPFEMEYRLLHVSGEYRWLLDIGSPNYKSTGEFIGYIGNCFDITDRKRTEESLMKLKTAIDKSEISVIITDRNGNIEFANPFFSKLTGYSPDEYIGKTPGILKSEYHPKEFYEEMWNTIIAGETWEGEFYNRNKNGEMYWENAIISPVTNRNNEITHFVAIKTDITHAKNINSELIIAKEHAEESDRLKSAFLANMSHEIRTPMNGILGFTELLKDPDLSDDQRKYFISIIEKSGERLLNIINDIIDISKIESGLMKVKNSGINVNEYLDQVLTFFKLEAEAKNIKLICKPGLPGEEAFLETDSEKFYAILINLVKNALKYTETGFVEFGYNRNHSYLQFYVKDTGIGIPKDRQEAIFERFVQADIANKMARQGTGLGLSISRAYVEMLRGNIWVESAEGIGSTFYFTLPGFAEPKEKSIVENGVQAIVEGNMAGSLKILIAEDDETSSKLISIRVRKFGSEIIYVETGTEAVEVCRANPDIDLILMDIQMPEMSGYEATRQIRKFNSEVIIIALTAFALAGDREKSIEAGCNDYISKPIQKDELVEMIQKYFKRYEDER